MYEQLNGRGLIAFSDPAGAKACLALAALLKKTYNNEVLIISNKEYAFYRDWSCMVQIIEAENISSLNYLPDWIFTATSHPDSSKGFELKVLEAFKGTYSFSFIDHWTNMRLRFQQYNALIFPDIIVVTDEYARLNAIREGLPAQKLLIHPNPYLDYINKFWQPAFSRNEVLHLLHIEDPNTKLLLYAPDPISLRNEDGRWHFDELSVLRELTGILDEMPALTLVLKLHPLQPMEKINEYLKSCKKSTSIVIAENADNLELLNRADMLIGFHSNLLIEANAVNPKLKIIRYFPASQEQDAIRHLNIGRKITYLSDLLEEIATLS